MAYAEVPVSIGGAGGIIYAAQAITAFQAGTPGQIVAAGADFVANGVVRGDAAVVAGSTSNNGTYIVLDVINPTTIEVTPAPTIEAAAGTVTTREQNHRLDIIDEATTSAALIAAAVSDARLFSETLPAVPAQTAGRGWRKWRFLFREFRVSHTGATNTVFSSSREVWSIDWDRSGVGVASSWIGTTPAADPGTLEIDIGSLVIPADPRSVQGGSVFLGGGWSGVPLKAQSRVHMSFFALTSSQGVMSFDDGAGTGRCSGVMVDGVAFTPGLGGSLSQLNHLVLSSPNFGLTPVGNLANAQTLLVADSATFGVIFGATAEVPVGPGLELSDAVAAPALLMFTNAARVPDPEEFYPPATMFQNSSGCGRLGYTYDPRFIELNALVGPQPLVGATVSIERISDGHYMQLLSAVDGTYTITINGEDHTHVASGQTAAQLRNSLRDAVNAGGQPVTATNSSNGGQVAGTGFIINADVIDTPMEIAITAQPAASLVLDPAPVTGAALLALANGGDYREGPISGSPFTTDANGRINTTGVNLDAYIGYESTFGLRFINLFYLIRVNHPFFGPTELTFKPTATFTAQLGIPLSRMQGSLG